MTRRVRLAVQKAIRARVEITDADRGTAALALVYADAIDNGADLQIIGPLLLATLDALLMTPKARQAVLKGATSGTAPRTPLDELRQRRARKA